jgi:hypothetical protein
MAYYDNDHELGIYKTQVWTVGKIDVNFIFLTRGEQSVTLDKKTFKHIFSYSFCATVHKFQGMTIKDHYNIYEADCDYYHSELGHRIEMTADVLYTAISRGVSKDRVHVVAKKATYNDPTRVACIAIKPKKIAMKTGRIYEITMENGYKYIGKTQKTIEERFQQHLEHPTNDGMLQHLTDKATIKELISFQYADEKVMNAVEKRYIKEAAGVKLNVQHNTTKKTVTTAPKVKKVKVINITTDEAKKRFEVRLQRACIKECDRVKRFPWGTDRTAAQKQAEDWREHLYFTYY